MWLNDFPIKCRVSSAFSPQTIMTVTALDWKKHCGSEFGAYCEVHEENLPLNNINNEGTQSSIYLDSTTNFQGCYTFLYLTTGKRIT